MALISYELGLSTARRQGIEQGIHQGVEQGIEQGSRQRVAEVLQRQLTIEFGLLPARATARIAKATDKQLLNWLDGLLLATTLDSVFEAERE